MNDTTMEYTLRLPAELTVRSLPSFHGVTVWSSTNSNTPVVTTHMPVLLGVSTNLRQYKYITIYVEVLGSMNY